MNRHQKQPTTSQWLQGLWSTFQPGMVFVACSSQIGPHLTTVASACLSYWLKWVKLGGKMVTVWRYLGDSPLTHLWRRYFSQINFCQPNFLTSVRTFPSEIYVRAFAVCHVKPHNLKHWDIFGCEKGTFPQGYLQMFLILHQNNLSFLSKPTACVLKCQLLHLFLGSGSFL